MYPVFPTIDLKEENIYDAAEPHQVGFKQSLAVNTQTEYIHTIFNLNDDERLLTNDEDISRLIMFAFGSAYAQAQLLSSKKVKFLVLLFEISPIFISQSKYRAF